MKLLLWLLTFVTFGNLQAIAGSYHDFSDFHRLIYGAPPPHDVAEWTKLRVVGRAITASPPIIWISSQAFERNEPEVLIKLSATEYRIFVSLVQERRCSGILGGEPHYPSIEITTQAKGFASTRCAMRDATACELFSSIAIHKLHWADARWEPIRILRDGLNCRDRRAG